MISHARKEAIIFHLKLKALIGEFHGNDAFKMTFFFKKSHEIAHLSVITN